MRKEVLPGPNCPFGNGTATARALARLYAMMALEGELDGIRIISPETVRRLERRYKDWPPISSCSTTACPA